MMGSFGRAVEECVAFSEPFLKVLREVSGGKPAMGFIYELMTRAKESIRTYYIMDEIKCKTFLDIVIKIGTTTSIHLSMQQPRF